tara:strand:- start:303 stop:1031 length:729 start_codon:yes stop_codon:yes gene_type:complete
MAPTTLYSGAALLSLVIFLALFNARKKIPFLPLFRASTWMQWHIYLGFFSVLLFLLHVDFRIPSGLLEIVLAIVFVIVAVSGVFGLMLSRSLPRRMNQAGDPVPYEQIPRIRKEIRDSVKDLIVHSEETCDSSTLSEFYREHLREFIEARPSVFHSFGMEKKRTSYQLTNELEARMRYLSESEIEVASELESWIGKKENIDFQEASQRLLKGWLFLHIPFSVSLILLGVAHGIFALLFGGNA